MQITKVEVTSVELTLRRPVQLAHQPVITHVSAIFVRLETRDGRNAWGCTVAHPALNGEKPAETLAICRDCAEVAPDLHPFNVEYSLARLAPIASHSAAALCAFDLAFHDLLGLMADMPLYRILGGFRHRIQTSVTVPIAPLNESVEMAECRARQGFRMLKVKGGVDPEEDVRRVRAIHTALPDLILRLDADGGYSKREALDVARALRNELEMLEQPTSPGDIEALREVSQASPIPILADQSACGLSSVLTLAAGRMVHGLSIKLGSCGGLRFAGQADAIARAAGLTTMVSCLIEPALLIAAGLSFALSSPNVRYGDLDGHLDLLNDPTEAGFLLQDGWLITSDVPGLGCRVNL